MGHIVKAVRDPEQASSSSTAGVPGPDREAMLAEATEWLVRARASALAATVEAKEVALLLARKMAERIIGHAVELDARVMGDIVGQALAVSRGRASALVLRIHPDDIAAIELSRPSWRERVAADADVRIVGDDSVGRNGCVVESELGRVDARLDAQLGALERALRVGPFR
jgi:flagellar biosynthesis/type III secretory pathway protein FliH